jgi:MFS family permease
MVALLCGVYAVAMLSRFVVFLLAPGMKASLGISDTQVSLLNGAAFAFFNAAALPVFGRLADRSNRRNLLLFGLIGWSLATVACGFAQTFAQIVAARIAVGIFQAALGPAAISIVADEAPQELRGRAIAIVVSGSTFGGAAANFLGGGLLQLFSAWPPAKLPFGVVLAPWQSVLIVCGMPGLLLAPLLLAIREPPRQSAPAGTPFRLLPHLKNHRGAFLPLFAGCICFLMAGYAQANWVPVLLLRNLHMAPAAVGVTTGVIALAGGAVAAVLGGYLSDRFVRRDPAGGRLKLMLVLLPLMAAASTLIAAVDHPSLVIASFALTATVATMVTQLAYTILPELAPSAGRGQILAGFGLIGNICGMGLAPTAVALITDQILHDERRLPLSLALVAAPALLLAGVLVALALPRARSLREKVMALTGEA